MNEATASVPSSSDCCALARTSFWDEPRGGAQHLTEHVGFPLDRKAHLAQMARLEAKLQQLPGFDPRREGPARVKLARGVAHSRDQAVGDERFELQGGEAAATDQVVSGQRLPLGIDRRWLAVPGSLVLASLPQASASI